MLSFHVERHDSLVQIVGNRAKIVFEVSHPEMLADDVTFAAWALLPVAMSSGQEVIIDGPGDAITEQNARQLSQIWAHWSPELFRPASVKFTSHHHRGAVDDPAGATDLLLFSGGVDSTYNLLRRHRDGLKQSLLTLRGLDYRVDDEPRFAQMVEKTESIVALSGSSRHYVATNAYSFYRRFGVSDAGLTHGFVLASALFLMGRGARVGEISADYARHQEFIVAPWGTNSLTNELFASSTFRMHTECLDVTRSQKMKALYGSPEALASLSFCKDYSSRPHNCGVCSKCVRTKYMFLAATGNLPDIFADNAISPNLIKTIDLGKRSEKAFFLDLAMCAEENGTTSLIPGLGKRYEALRKKPAPAMRFLKKHMASVRKRLTV